MRRSLGAFIVTTITCAAAVLGTSNAFAQANLKVTGAQKGFAVAVADLCLESSGAPYDKKIPQFISQDLDLSGFFNVLPAASYVESPGKCAEPNFSDWSVIGAEGLVRGKVVAAGNTLRVELFLYDVRQQKALLGKRYEADGRDFAKIAHRFANEIIRVFTGEPGIFGATVAFVGRIGRLKELFVVDLDGENLRQVSRDHGLAMSPSWSPDGKEIVYLSYRTKKPDLWITGPTGGTPRQLTDRPGIEVGPKFMPDGNTIVASASFDGNSNLVLFDMRGNIVRRLTNTNWIDTSPAPSPSGAEIAFVSNRGGGPQIYVMPSGGGEARRVSFTGNSYCTSPSWGPKGDKIAFVCQSGGNQLFVGPASGGQATQVTFSGSNEDPSFSPDGRYLLFSSTSRGPRRIMLLPLHTGVPKPLAFQQSEDSQPVWAARPN